MDYRLALLVQLFFGLKIEPAELDDLSDPSLDVRDRNMVLGRIRSAAALRHLHLNPGWEETSRRLLAAGERHGVRWSYVGRPDYPELWSGMHLRPAIFSYQGEPCWIDHGPIAVVGSRTPAADTLRWMTRELGEFLFRHDVCVVSGGARGVDQRAHRLALDLGRPTVCILPSGLLNPYPPANGEMWNEIRGQGGCMLSTCAPMEPMHRGFFELRNRWIAGLSYVCLVAEANRRSGSFMTARLAAEEGRALCTLPVSPMAAQGLGNFDLYVDFDAVFVRDHLDLGVLWARATPAPLALYPALFQDSQTEEQKDHVDQPKSDGGGQDSALGHMIGPDVAHPIGDQQHQADHEAAAARGSPVGDRSQPDSEQSENQARAGQ
jgi:DNA protecting protein DprA